MRFSDIADIGSRCKQDLLGIEASAACWLIQGRIHLLGLDLPSVHPTEHENLTPAGVGNTILLA